MDYAPFELTPSQLAGMISGPVKSSECVLFTPGGLGGWGIVRVALMVPESFLLFIGPQGCGRHGSLAGIQHGFSDRMAFYHLSEIDLVTGDHADRVYEVLKQVLALLDYTPKAIYLLSTCVDTLLGTDFEQLAADVEEIIGIPVRDCYMNPITTSRKSSPLMVIQKAAYSFLEPVKKKKVIHMIGRFRPIDRECELHELLAKDGYKLVHIGDCKSYEDFRELGSACLNILCKPNGKLAAKDIENRLAIPFLEQPETIDPRKVDLYYRQISSKLSLVWNYKDDFDKACLALKACAENMQGYRVAVGCNTFSSPFGIARVLAEWGVNVQVVFAAARLASDKDDLDWLALYRPDIRVIMPDHPAMASFDKSSCAFDLAIGLEAGYFYQKAKTMPAGLGSQYYGFAGICRFLEDVQLTLEEDMTHKELVYKEGLVI